MELNQDNEGFLRSLRHKLGLSQQDVAQYLGVSQPLIALSESAKRELPTKAVIDLMRLATSYDEHTPAEELPLVHDLLEEEQNQHLASLNKLLAQWRGRAATLEKGLEKQRRQREAALRQVQTLRRMQQQMDATDDPSRPPIWDLATDRKDLKQAWLKFQLRQAIDRFHQSPLSHILIKEAQLAALQSQISKLEALVGAASGSKPA